MVVSLGSGFCGFAGFLAYPRLAELLQGFPQLTEVLGANNVAQYLDAGSKGEETRRQLVSAASVTACTSRDHQTKMAGSVHMPCECINTCACHSAKC